MSISLIKGDTVSLQKNDGKPLSEIFLGLGWDPVKSFFSFGKSEDIDLDSSCIMFNAQGQEVDAVWYQRLESKDHSVTHSGDNRTGRGKGDDEVINVNLDKVHRDIETLVFTINSYTGESFNKIANANVRIVDRATQIEEFRYNLSQTADKTALVMVKVFRFEKIWKMKAIGEFADGKNYQKLVSIAQSYLK